MKNKSGRYWVTLKGCHLSTLKVERIKKLEPSLFIPDSASSEFARPSSRADVSDSSAAAAAVVVVLSGPGPRLRLSSLNEMICYGNIPVPWRLPVARLDSASHTPWRCGCKLFSFPGRAAPLFHNAQCHSASDAALSAIMDHTIIIFNT
jgi:hypothetical protein